MDLLVISHWAAVATMLVLGTLEGVLDRVLWDDSAGVVWWRRLGQRTIQAQAILLGAVVGLLPGVPVGELPGTEPGLAGRVLYFAAAGAVGRAVVRYTIGKLGGRASSVPPEPQGGAAWTDAIAWVVAVVVVVVAIAVLQLLVGAALR